MAKRKPSKPKLNMRRKRPDSHLFEVKRPTVIQGRRCKPGWYYWDEAEQLGGGPFPSKGSARVQILAYAKHLEGPSQLPGKFTRSPAMGKVRRSLGEVQADLDRLQDLSKSDLVILAMRMREALIVVAAHIWRDLSMNACGINTGSVAVHAIEEALNYRAPAEKRGG